MARTSGPEAQLYPVVERWARDAFGCWETAIDSGPRIGRVDVAGVRDVGGGDLASRSEVVAFEVKTGTASFAKSAGQAHGYSVMADRCYIAVKANEITNDQLVIATQLRVGVLKISAANRVKEVMSAPLNDPIMQFRLQLLEKLNCAPCALCSTVFRIGNAQNHFANLVRRESNDARDLSDAAELERGLVWWLWRHSAERDSSGRAMTYRRRYLCPDCVFALAPRAARTQSG